MELARHDGVTALRVAREEEHQNTSRLSFGFFLCACVGPVVCIVLCVLRDTTRREKEGERDFCVVVVVGFKRIISLSLV